MSATSETITSPQLALQSYLDDLLQDAFTAMEDPHAQEFAEAVAEEKRLEAKASAQLAPPTPLFKTDVLAPNRAAPAPSVPTAAAPVATVALAPGESEGLPEWAQEPFECLLFDVAGLTLAVPLISLGSIYKLSTDQLTPIFGQPEWFLGMMQSQAGNLKIMDTARAVLAERYKPQMRDGLQYAISVQGYEWALAVHQVSRAIRLDPKQVKWRHERRQRPWLAGTVIEHMCALLDVEALAKLIAKGAFHSV